MFMSGERLFPRPVTPSPNTPHRYRIPPVSQPRTEEKPT